MFAELAEYYTCDRETHSAVTQEGSTNDFEFLVDVPNQTVEQCRSVFSAFV